MGGQNSLAEIYNFQPNVTENTKDNCNKMMCLRRVSTQHCSFMVYINKIEEKCKTFDFTALLYLKMYLMFSFRSLYQHRRLQIRPPLLHMGAAVVLWRQTATAIWTWAAWICIEWSNRNRLIWLVFRCTFLAVGGQKCSSWYDVMCHIIWRLDLRHPAPKMSPVNQYERFYLFCT